MIYEGSCHCGAVTVEYETSEPVALRQDGCSFCATRGVKSTSDPAGALRLTSGQSLVRYRFGHKTADFLICSTCGTYLATVMEGPNGPIGVLNVVGLNIPELHDLPFEVINLEGEEPDARMSRRTTRWTPLALIEPEAATSSDAPSRNRDPWQ